MHRGKMGQILSHEKIGSEIRTDGNALAANSVNLSIHSWFVVPRSLRRLEARSRDDRADFLLPVLPFTCFPN